MSTWRLIEEAGELLVLSNGEATLLVEKPRPTAYDPDLRTAIARLAPHLAFGDLVERHDTIERHSTSDAERVVIGRMTRGAMSIVYLATSHSAVAVDDVLLPLLGNATSPFAHYAE